MGVSIRTMLLDNATRHFIDNHPKTIVVNLGAGLDTRFERLNQENLTWYDLDVPEAIALRSQFFTENDKYHFISKSCLDLTWFDNINIQGQSLLILAEGLLMYFSSDEVKYLFRELAARFPYAEILFDMLAPVLVGRSQLSDSVSKIRGGVEFKWGLKNSREMETWHDSIKFVEEWNYYDYHKNQCH